MSTTPGKKVLTLRDLRIGFDKPLFTVPEADMYREEKVAIIGPNGCGKTTLLNTIMGEHPALSGTCELGHNVKYATFSQRQEGLHGRETVLDAVLSRASLTISEARGVLGRFLFTGDEVDKKMESLSGGERSRIALALLSLIEGNLLLLDEPTNHLDLASQEILEHAVEQYPGTVLLVSHDRALLEAVTTQVWVIEDDTLRVYGYGYTEYRRRRDADEATLKKKTSDRKPSRSQNEEHRLTQGSNSRTRKREIEQQQLEADIEALEHRIQEIETALAAASALGDAHKVAELGSEHQTIQQKLKEIYTAWNEIAERQED